MKCSIHQPHFFPWLGYFDKMAKTDAFVLLDEVQFVQASYMVRNRVISQNGNIEYLTITCNRRGYLEKKYSEIPTVDNKGWKRKHLGLLQGYYRKAPGYNEVMDQLQEFYRQDFPTVCEWTIASVKLVREWLGITTPLLYQSDISYDRANKRSDMDMEICKSVGADVYFSGRGFSVEYLDREKFAQNGIQIVFQDFTPPVYPQLHTTEFVPGLSSLDMFLNCGIGETRRLFWENVKRANEFKTAKNP